MNTRGCRWKGFTTKKVSRTRVTVVGKQASKVSNAITTILALLSRYGVLTQITSELEPHRVDQGQWRIKMNGSSTRPVLADIGAATNSPRIYNQSIPRLANDWSSGHGRQTLRSRSAILTRRRAKISFTLLRDDRALACKSPLGNPARGVS